MRMNWAMGRGGKAFLDGSFGWRFSFLFFLSYLFSWRVDTNLIFGSRCWSSVHIFVQTILAFLTSFPSDLHVVQQDNRHWRICDSLDGVR